MCCLFLSDIKWAWLLRPETFGAMSWGCAVGAGENSIMIVGGANTAEWQFSEEALQVSVWPTLQTQ